MKTKILIVSSLIVAGVILSTGCAGKFHKGNFGDFIFEKFDKNEDSKLNKKEHLDIAFSRFERIDDNEDGNLTKKELNNSLFSNMKLNFVDYYLNRNDLNSDERVTRSEIIEQAKKEFIKLDNNNDGVLSKEEYEKQKSPFKK